MEYTKGEWTVEDETNIFCGDRLIATAGGYSDNYTSPRAENKANARLIATAPELYEACVSVSKWLEALLSTGVVEHPIIRSMKMAVDKAIASVEGVK